jgi:hypothetical protein
LQTLPQLPWKQKRGDLKKNWIPFIKLSSVWQLLGLQKNQNGGCCHGNQGAKNVKYTPNFTKLCSNVSCHIHI